MVGFFLLSQSTKSLHMDTHEEQETHLRDTQGVGVGLQKHTHTHDIENLEEEESQ